MRNVWFAVLLGTSVSMVFAQDPLDRDSWNVNAGAWDVDDNWVDDAGEPSGVPTLDNDRWALVDRGVATVSGFHKTSGLTIGNGTVEIATGSSLEVALQDDAFSVGQTQINRTGTLRILGDGSYKGLDGNVRGTVEMSQPGSFELSGEATLSGTYALTITGAGSPLLKIGGEATLGGTIAPRFDGVRPAFGDSFTFLQAQSLAANDVSVQLPADVSLGRGLEARVEAEGNAAKLVFGNLPILQINRASGAAQIMNVVGGPLAMTGYSVESAKGLLKPEAFTGLGGATWDRPNPSTTVVSEISLTQAVELAVEDAFSIGDIYNGGGTHPSEEDVMFRFGTPDGAIREGLVEYVGPANDLVLNLNPETGEATLQHLSSFLDPIEITGYSVVSPSGGLKTESWTSLFDTGAAGAGWVEANPKSSRLSELNVENATTFSTGTAISLGEIWDPSGARDLMLTYSTTSDEVLMATVEYQVPDPMELLPGDVDGNGTVEFADFLILSANFGNAVDPTGCCGDINGDGMVSFPDFLVLSANFGQSAASVAAVPEPRSLVPFVLGVALWGTSRRRRQPAQPCADVT